MRFLRAPIRWVLDWRTGATFAVTALVVLLTFIVFDASAARDQALDTALDQRQAATRRIDMLLAEVANLREDAEANGQRIGELLDQVAVLQEQVRQLGGRPVVVQTTTTARRSSPTTQPRSTTTTTQPRRNPPATTTTTTQPDRTCVGPLCLP
jgi:TolA-binding protein